MVEQFEKLHNVSVEGSFPVELLGFEKKKKNYSLLKGEL